MNKFSSPFLKKSPLNQESKTGIEKVIKAKPEVISKGQKPRPDGLGIRTDKVKVMQNPTIVKQNPEIIKKIAKN